MLAALLLPAEKAFSKTSFWYREGKPPNAAPVPHSFVASPPGMQGEMARVNRVS